jgi:hypothetical protein
MNKFSKTTQENVFYSSYHIPGQNNYVKRPKRGIFLNTHNDLKHEMKKVEVCYDLQKNKHLFITEAARNVKKGEESKTVDIVDCTDGTEIEIIYRHENDETIKKYREDGVLPIIVEPMRCEICGEKYPKRSKKDICGICKKK